MEGRSVAGFVRVRERERAANVCVCRHRLITVLVLGEWLLAYQWTRRISSRAMIDGRLAEVAIPRRLAPDGGTITHAVA